MNAPIPVPPVDVAAGPWLALGLAIVAGALVAAVVLMLIRAERRHAETALRLQQVAGLADALARHQADLQGEIAARLDALGHRLGDGLIRQTERTGDSLRAVHERLAEVDAAGRTLSEVATRVAALQQVFGNKQARGAFGERQLEDLIRSVLPPSAFRFQATLSTRARADCLLLLPDPPGAIVVDAKFPLEGYLALCEANGGDAEARARRAFAADCIRHLRDIADRYILPGETADQALMFLPSEAVFAELHARCRDVVEESFRLKVWLVSPTTLWATVMTLRSVVRHVRLDAETKRMAAEFAIIADEAARLDDRARRLEDHLRQADADVVALRQRAAALARRAANVIVDEPVAVSCVQTPDKG